ncbi:MAG: helix-hairpin-helix domain-containing protein [candidate division WOR-3 bacterium]
MRFYNKKNLLIILIIFTSIFAQDIEEEELNETLIEEIYQKEFIKLKINKAEYNEILDIPGISKDLAKKIIEERKNGFFIDFNDFKHRLNLSPEYDYLENYFDFNVFIFNFYQETKGTYNDKYGENKFYRSVKGKIKGLYSIFDFGFTHYNFSDIDKFYGELKYKGLSIILGDYIFEFGKGLLFGKYYAFSPELFYLPSNLKRLRPVISYSRDIGIRGAAFSYKNFDTGFGYEKDTFYIFFISFPFERLQIFPLVGFLKDLKENKNLHFFSLTGTIFGPLYLFYEIGFINKKVFFYSGIRKIYDFSRLFVFIYSLPKNHINYFNTKFDWKREGRDEYGVGVRWEGKFKRILLKFDERIFLKSEKKGGYESYIRGSLKLTKPFSYFFEIKDRKTSIHRLRFKNELNHKTKEFEISYKLNFEWDNYLLTSPGILGGIEFQKGIFFTGIYSFNINDYDKRIYVYEAEPPSSFYLEPLYGNGSRLYLGLRIKSEMLYILAKYSENISDRVLPDRRVIFIITLKSY